PCVSTSYTYDDVGNRLNQDGVEGAWSYNDNNELLTFADTEYQYDDNGNATQLLLDGAVMFGYHYDAQDRLVKVDDVNGGMIAEYAYDPFGRRLWKEVGGTRTYFFYADEGLVAEYDAAGNEIRAYGYKPDSTWTTDPLWLKQNGEYYFYQSDHLGTPQKLVKQNGAVVWSASYTAFGQARVELETVTNNLRFPGQYYDAEIGLHYNYHRTYEPTTGRYIQTDPIGFGGWDVNLYAYVGNNPVLKDDPWGLSERDRKRICEMSRQYVQQEVDAGNRFKYGWWWNNFLATVGRMPYKGCGEQRDEFIKFVDERDSDFEHVWTPVKCFIPPLPLPRLPHEFVTFYSSNPADNQILVDVWHGKEGFCRAYSLDIKKKDTICRMTGGYPVP
ncbi:MAG: hypothetical protein GY801_17680, partial [bacterium]|nr:hypothetical protein [bacterium]